MNLTLFFLCAKSEPSTKEIEHLQYFPRLEQTKNQNISFSVVTFYLIDSFCVLVVCASVRVEIAFNCFLLQTNAQMNRSQSEPNFIAVKSAFNQSELYEKKSPICAD